MDRTYRCPKCGRSVTVYVKVRSVHHRCTPNAAEARTAALTQLVVVAP